MKLSDCTIGMTFDTSEGRRWRVTDVGTRTLLAIVIDDPRDGPVAPAWLQGPPYALTEEVFDEHRISNAWTSMEQGIRDSMVRTDHPGFSSEVVNKMMRVRLTDFDGRKAYPHPNLLHIDRWDEASLDVLHPYGVRLTPDGWAVNLYALFAKTFSKELDAVFVEKPIATPAHFKKGAKVVRMS